MKIVWDGFRAVTVELIGVLLVVWLLFGCASWGLRGAVGERTSWTKQASDLLGRTQT